MNLLRQVRDEAILKILEQLFKIPTILIFILSFYTVNIWTRYNNGLVLERMKVLEDVQNGLLWTLIPLTISAFLVQYVFANAITQERLKEIIQRNAIDNKWIYLLKKIALYFCLTSIFFLLNYLFGDNLIAWQIGVVCIGFFIF